MIKSIIELFYPRICPGCNTVLVTAEKNICTSCNFHLPRTGHWEEKDNTIAKIFWGRVQIENAAAYLFFQKKGRLQKIIHEIKYKNQKELGIELGRMFGNELKKSHFSQTELIVPVPLHPSRLKKRGYNQSEIIAKGISEAMNIPIEPNAIGRISENKSQTTKSRYERWENVQSIFEVTKPELLSGKHVLLVDDVLTTGATIEACATAILKVPETKVSVASLAYSSKN